MLISLNTDMPVDKSEFKTRVLESISPSILRERSHNVNTFGPSIGIDLSKWDITESCWVLMSAKHDWYSIYHVEVLQVGNDDLNVDLDSMLDFCDLYDSYVNDGALENDLLRSHDGTFEDGWVAGPLVGVCIEKDSIFVSEGEDGGSFICHINLALV